MTTPLVRHATYLERAFAGKEEWEKIALELDGETLGHSIRYDTIVGTGLSGTIVVPYVAEYLGKHWAIVRKEDGSLSGKYGRTVEGRIGRRYVFLDDLIDTGRTFRRVYRAMEVLCLNNSHRISCAGIYEYDTTTFTKYRKRMSIGDGEW